MNVVQLIDIASVARAFGSYRQDTYCGSRCVSRYPNQVYIVRAEEILDTLRVRWKLRDAASARVSGCPECVVLSMLSDGLCSTSKDDPLNDSVFQISCRPVSVHMITRSCCLS